MSTFSVWKQDNFQKFNNGYNIDSFQLCLSTWFLHGSLQASEQEITVGFHIKIRMDSRVSIQYLIARLILPFLI